MPHLLKDGVSDFRIFRLSHLFRQAEGIKEDPKILCKCITLLIKCKIKVIEPRNG